MHLYVPSTLAELRAFLAAGVVGPVPINAYAVTDGVREAFADGNDEELEYAAQHLAADASLRRLAGDPESPRRRVVIVLEVSEDALDDEDGLETGAVELITETPVRRLVSALVDDPAAESAVARVIAVPDGVNALEDLDDHQLLWFAAQELGEL
jgi:hypothetical protein